MKHAPNSLTIKHVVMLIIAALFAMSILFVNKPVTVDAATATELQSDIDRLDAEIARNEAYLAQISAEVDSLENRIAQMEAEIAQIEIVIEKTELQIEQLTIELKLAEEELERQKGILSESLKTLYIEGNVSTIDLVLASDNFTDFINHQEYLSQLKNSVQESAERVVALKAEIEVKLAEQEELLEKNEVQKKGLNDAKAEQQKLLEATRGQESRYRGIVNDLAAQHEQAIEALEEFLINQTFTSLGKVDRGDVIGFMGNTGFSTGVHLHFAVWDNGRWVNPQISGMNLINGYLWPSESTRITALFGASGCGEYVCGHTHYGLDIGASVSGVPGDLIYAADDGDIVWRGCSGSCGGGFGYYVIIDHGGGVLTYYGHLQN